MAIDCRKEKCMYNAAGLCMHANPQLTQSDLTKGVKCSSYFSKDILGKCPDGHIHRKQCDFMPDKCVQCRLKQVNI